jgi:hypothetical protein
MSNISDEKALEIGRAVLKILEGGDWPRVLVFDLYDHKRRVDITDLHAKLREAGWSPETDGLKDQGLLVSVAFSDGFGR